jgi:serine/threonine protein kinase
VAAAAQKRAEMSNRSTAKTPKNGSLVENFVKQLLENAKTEKMPSSENIIPSSVKGTFVHPDKYFIDVADILPKKEKTPQHNIQTPPVLFSNKNQAPEEKESVPRKPSVQNDINILGIDPAEKEFKMKKFKEDYIIGKQIGQGAYATVRIGVHKPTNTKVAIKIYEKVKIMDPMRSRSVKREIKLMQRIDHQSIIKIYDVVETNNHMNIIMEYIGGTSLHSFLKAQPNRRLKEEHAFNIFKQVVNGLYYCHGRCIAHRDIKLENMLLDSYGNLKIIDFGFSTCIPNDKKVRMFCGTPSYMAPEIVTKAEYCGPPADIWALGVLLYALLCGTFPFKGIDDKDLYAKIAKGDFVIPEFVSEHAQSLLRKMMSVDPDKRLGAKEVMSDPWYVMHAFMDKKTDRRVSSRSSSSLDRTRLEKPDSKPNFPSNLNIVQPVGEQQFTQIANFIKSPQNQFQRDEYAKVDIRNIRRKDDDHPRDQVRHLSLNNSRYTGKQNYVDKTYGNIRNISNLNDGDTLVYEDNADDNKLSFKKTLTENEVWNIPANISSEKSFQPAFGRNSQMSAFQNKSLKRNEDNNTQAVGGQFDPEIINNLTKMGYKDEEINTGLKEKTGAVYYIYNRMVNERKAQHNSNFVDSITSDQNTNNNNNNNSFNLSSHMALKRKSVNMAVSKNPQEKENIYNTLQPKTGSTKDEMGASEM